MLSRPIVRFWLGMAQMFAAVVAFTLLLSTGPSTASLVAAAAATPLTLTSKWLFGQR